MELKVSSRSEGDRVVVALSGEIDLYTAPRLQSQLASELNVDHPVRLVVDMSGVDFCVSPVAFAWILDRTGSWTLPFAVSVCLLLFAIVMTYWIRPDRPIEAVSNVGRLAVAGE